MNNSAPKPKLSYSWEEVTFSESQVLVWDDDSYVINDSGSFTADVYSASSYKYNESGGYVIREDSTITMDANFTSSVNITTSGNSTLNIDIDMYQVNVDYGQNVKLYWFAGKNGTIEHEYFLSKRVENYSYYEESHSYIETTYEKFNLTTWELMDTWNDTTEVYDEINVTHTLQKEFYPFYQRSYYSSEFVTPLFLTVQIFTTQANDKIAWANLLFDYIIYKDKDHNGILTVGNEPTWGGPPTLGSSTEWCGAIVPIAANQYWNVETNETAPLEMFDTKPSDKTIDELASSIEFSPPVEISETEVSWDVSYPEFPLDMYIVDKDAPTEEWYLTPGNATHSLMSPTNLTYGFDFTLNDTQADFDITWGIGKLTNDTAYNAAQGYGLVVPQYNFFLSSFDIDEVNPKSLSVPRDKFTFKSNDTIVAEINMGKPEKKNYTLYDFPSLGIDTDFPSIGGSIHKNVIGFSSRSSYYDSPFMSAIFSLDDIVAQEASFVPVDDLFSMETENYPLWNGEKLVHDPSLSIFFAGIPGEPNKPGESIPSYNFPLLLGIISIVTTVTVVKLKKKSSS
ncbi:MAG: hypothetical protein ACXACX_02565 [Candidatus Hodarchaeales archaeon]